MTNTYWKTASLVLLTMVIATDTGRADQSPNILLIIADDMNWNDCGAYGHPAIRTPNIDSLARQGMRFEHAYLTASSCSPSRASIITGRYPHNTGAEQLHWPLPPDATTFVERLKHAGYYTAAVGKWHLGEAVENHFDVVREASTAGFQLPSGPQQESPRMIAGQPSGCEKWIDQLRERPRGKPFFFWLAALDPHREYEPGALDPPHSPHDVQLPPYLPDTPAVRDDLTMYYDEIGRLDQYVGRVLQELDRQQVADNTVVLFISDNGRPFPRDKTTLYDGGIRTPWIVRWPGHIEAGVVSQSLVSSVDLAPTFLEIAGLPIPETFAGTSICPILSDPTASVRNYVFAEDHWHDFEDHARCVGTQRYKLIRNDYYDLPATPSADALRSPTWQAMRALRSAGGLTASQENCFLSPRPKYELYDLQQDPDELHNVYQDVAYRAERDRLLAALRKWTRDTGDYLPSRRTPDEFDRETGEPDHRVRKRPRPSKLDMFGTYGKY